MDGPGDKLDQLHAGDVAGGDFFNKISMSITLPLPPQVLLHFGSKGRHEVVEVHDNMDTNVEEHEECRVAATNKPVRNIC